MTCRKISVALAACVGLAGGGFPATWGDAAEPQAPPATPAAAPAVVPQGQPQQISDWALAGVLWSDAHLVRRLATAASRHPDAGDQAASLQAVATQTEQLINALESLGWKRIAQAEAAAPAVATTAAAAATGPVDPAVPDLRPALADRPATRTPPVEEPEAIPPSAKIPTERSGVLQEQLEIESSRRAGAVGLDAEVLPGAGSAAIARYRVGVGEYIDETPAEALDPLDAIEDGVEGALAAGADNVSTPLDLFDPDAEVVAPPVIDDVEVEVQVDRTPLREPVAESDEDLTAQLIEPLQPRDATPAPAATPVLTIDRYTDRSQQYAQDAPWVQFRVDANQQRWQMLRSESERMPLSQITEQLRAALLQLRADAAVAERAADDSELAAILAKFRGN